MENLNVLIDEQKICKRLDELATQIENDYNSEELICIGILKVLFRFYGNLVKECLIAKYLLNLCNYLVMVLQPKVLAK